jgi:hypothetical protein
VTVSLEHFGGEPLGPSGVAEVTGVHECREPASSIWSRSRSSSSVRRATSRTVAPAPARRSAVARPTPEEAPVTSTIFPETVARSFCSLTPGAGGADQQPDRTG